MFSEAVLGAVTAETGWGIRARGRESGEGEVEEFLCRYSVKRVSAGVLRDTDSAPSLLLTDNEMANPYYSLMWSVPNEALQ